MLDMSTFKSFSSYFYFFTPPHIILLLLSSCLLTISTAIPVSLSASSPSSGSSPFNNNNRNSNSRIQPPLVLPYRYNNNNYYGKNDDLISSPLSVIPNGQNEFLEDNLVENVAKDYLMNSRPPALNAELDEINPLLPIVSMSKEEKSSKSDEKLSNDEVNEVISNIIAAAIGNIPDESDYSPNQLDKHSFEILRKQIEKVKDEEDIQLKTELLEQILLNYPEGPLPVLYVEESKPASTPISSMDKRSGRYYRRYPWKRQQKGKGSYDPDARYMCTPTRDEIFRLLVGLHETHKGNERKLVNFCNRRRPAKTVFTNIRFLG